MRILAISDTTFSLVAFIIVAGLIVLFAFWLCVFITEVVCWRLRKIRARHADAAWMNRHGLDDLRARPKP